ncbi:hypothetical protein GGR26_002404 [Lewinella marina]|uniref:RNA-binding protein n=1 Tax=Neolewinella marina TaxID=438751 RepID=A0A2G0CBU7_9BACT|nr:VCBS repeat-containing protein [Neolewinella marina]NJB86627.1 hypothetical protein [Neolewinella marina]PHK97436.1 RNA-binding protein [Neolewinella marina]
MKVFVSLVLLFSLLALSGCRDESSSALFQRIDPAKSGLTFANRITENDTFNILDFEYVYNGGGVGAADFNGDGLTDLYFTGNTTENKLFLNLGDMRFQDVTELAGVSGRGRWCSGIAVTDINADGLPDLYVSATIYEPGSRRANLLYLNEGSTVNEDGLAIPQFREVAASCGIADTSHTTQSAFFDYDRDGDLDLYILVNEMDNRALPNRYLPKITDGSGRKNDKLYRNDGPGPDGLPRFTEVGKEAGILKEGFGLGVSVCDINADGWPDLYITNDYVSNDLLWINNQDGTFTDRAMEYLKHSSYSAMGNDVADLNNDGRDDVFTVDMFPEDNLRRKAMMPPNNYNGYLNNLRFNYLPQFTRNVLQLNQPVNDTSFILTEVGMMAGIAATDWSWSPLAADVDNDGDRDLLITNGFPRDITDRDFMDYNVQVSNLASRETRLAQIPSVKIPNYAYENDGNALPHFTKRVAEWGFDHPSFSNGAVYVDLDNDGDLDYVVNNINDSCFLFRNDLINLGGPAFAGHWLQLQLRGEGQNTQALGARVTVVSDSATQTTYNHPVRGFLSSVADVLHFGFRPGDSLQMVRVDWPDGESYIYKDVSWDQRVTLDKAGGQPAPPAARPAPAAARLVAAPDLLRGFSEHRDSLFIDFNVQPLLPHKLSEYGPGLAVADVNGDGLEDIYRSGSHFFHGELLLQGRNGKGEPTFTAAPALPEEAANENLGVLFFDADGDGDQDLYLVSGGSEFAVNRPELLDQLLLNDGQGRFTPHPAGLPGLQSSGSCVRAADVDRDGDLDLFVGGRLNPGRFPEAVDSYLLINDGRGSFAPASPPAFTALGLVTDALWTDYNADGWVDLLIAGQGMGLRLFENQKGTLRENSPAAFADHVGWWNGLAAADFDRDGDLDYAAGNFGANHLYGGSGSDFVGLYGGDLDGNGGYDVLVSDYVLAEDGTYREFPHHQRTDTEKQLISVKRRYPRHEDFGRATIEDVLSGYPEAKITALRSNYLRSAWIENLGDGNFAFHELPRAAQVAPLFGMQALDVNADGHPDLVAIGNDYGTETGMGMLNALNGLVLLFDPGSRTFIPAAERDFHVPGNGRSLTVVNVNGAPTLVASENQGPTTAYRLAQAGQLVRVPADAQRVTYTVNGKPSLTEVYYGSGYLSQRSRDIWLPAGATDIQVHTFKGATAQPSR